MLLPSHFRHISGVVPTRTHPSGTVINVRWPLARPRDNTTYTTLLFAFSSSFFMLSFYASFLFIHHQHHHHHHQRRHCWHPCRIVTGEFRRPHPAKSRALTWSSHTSASRAALTNPQHPLKHPSRPRLRARFFSQSTPGEVQPKRRWQQQAMTGSVPRSKRTVNSTRASRSTRLTDAGKLKSSRLEPAFGASSSLAGPFRWNARERFGTPIRRGMRRFEGGHNSG